MTTGTAYVDPDSRVLGLEENVVEVSGATQVAYVMLEESEVRLQSVYPEWHVVGRNGKY